MSFTTDGIDKNRFHKRYNAESKGVDRIKMTIEQSHLTKNKINLNNLRNSHRNVA